MWRRRARVGERDLVWIFGSPRSGSTWLLNMLAADPRVAAVDEPGIGAHLGLTMAGHIGIEPDGASSEHFRLADFREEAGSYFFSPRRADAWRPRLRELILERLRAEVGAPAGGRRVVVLKEPHGSEAADLLLSTLPASRAIFLLRDGRDVVDSELDAAAAGSWAMEQLPGFRLGDRSRFIRQRAHMWLWRTEVVERALAAHPAELGETVRYEELLADPEPILARLASWLGLDHATLREAAAATSFEAVPADRRGPGRFIRAAEPGGWRERLSAPERELLEGIVGDKVRALGY